MTIQINIINTPPEPNFFCPFCGTQIVSSLGTNFCEHLVFLYVIPSIDDEFFEFKTTKFAKQYLNKLKKSDYWKEEYEDHISPVDESIFFSNGAAKISEQKIRLHDDILSDDVLPPETLIFKVKETNRHYPTEVVIAIHN